MQIHVPSPPKLSGCGITLETDKLMIVVKYPDGRKYTINLRPMFDQLPQSQETSPEKRL